MKNLLLLAVFAFATICLQAQRNLYVQKIDGDQMEFLIVENPRITFGDDRTMTIQETTFQLSDVQNLSFVSGVPTSMVAVNTNENIFIFPNPVSEELSIVVENPQGMSFRIFDVSGRQIMSDQIHSQTTTINVQNLHIGTYILHISRNGEVVQALQVIRN